jgi:hypothetical protein
VLHYLNGTRLESLKYDKYDTKPLHGYCDSDWAGDPDDNKSTTGWVFIWNGAAISWQSKKQRSTAQSSCEAEYYAAGMASFEVSWLWNILSELHMTPLFPIKLYSDSQSAIHLAHNPVFHDRSKHIKTKWHYIREMIQEGLLSLEKVSTLTNVSDALTKPVPGPKLKFSRNEMGMSPIALFTHWMTGVTTPGFRCSAPAA